MKHPAVIETSLRHPGTGRLASVLRVERFGTAKPVSIATGGYVLVVASDGKTSECTLEHARAWITAGASYLCAWGPASRLVEEAFDYASFASELGEAFSFTLMTTSHVGEPIEEALWFAFYNATPPDDLPCELNSVVVAVDSAALESICVRWIEENIE